MKRSLAFLLVIVFLSSFLISSIVLAQEPSIPADVQEMQTQIKTFFKLPVIRHIIGIVFGLWDLDNVTGMYKLREEGKLKVVSDAGSIIIYIVIWLVLFMAFADIVKTFAPFSDKVGTLIGLGLAIAAAQMGAVYKLSYWLAGLVARLGTAAVFIGIFLAFLAFVLENTILGKIFHFIKERKWKREEEKAEETAQKGGAGVKHAASFEEQLKEAAEKGWRGI